MQYGNIMLRPLLGHGSSSCAGGSSSGAAAAGVCLIDYDYVTTAPVAFDIANHFCEWAADYHSGASPPHLLRYSQLPDEEEQRRFVLQYLQAALSQLVLVGHAPQAPACSTACVLGDGAGPAAHDMRGEPQERSAAPALGQRRCGAHDGPLGDGALHAIGGRAGPAAPHVSAEPGNAAGLAAAPQEDAAAHAHDEALARFLRPLALAQAQARGQPHAGPGAPRQVAVAAAASPQPPCSGLGAWLQQFVLPGHGMSHVGGGAAGGAVPLLQGVDMAAAADALALSALAHVALSHVHWGVWGVLQHRVSRIEGFDFLAYGLQRLANYQQCMRLLDV